MTKYIALNDTTYKFQFVRKGAEIEAGEELSKNVNFKRADGKAAKAEPSNPDNINEQEVRLRAKELKIANWHMKNPKTLLAEIAEAEAKLAAPVVTESDNGEGETEPKGDETPQA